MKLFFLHQHLSVRDAEINAIMMREDINVAVTLQRHCDLDQSVHGNTVFPGGSHYSPSVGGCRRSFKQRILTGTMLMSIAFCQISKMNVRSSFNPKSPAYVSSWILEHGRAISLFVRCSGVQMLLSSQSSSRFYVRFMRISGFIDSNRATTTTPKPDNHLTVCWRPANPEWPKERETWLYTYCPTLYSEPLTRKKYSFLRLRILWSGLTVTKETNPQIYMMQFTFQIFFLSHFRLAGIDCFSW